MKSEPGELTEVASQKNEKSEGELEEAWFVDGQREEDARRRSSVPPPPQSEKLGDFLGDELADAWLR